MELTTAQYPDGFWVSRTVFVPGGNYAFGTNSFAGLAYLDQISKGQAEALQHAFAYVNINKENNIDLEIENKK